MLIKTKRESYCVQKILSLIVPEKYEKKLESKAKYNNYFKRRNLDENRTDPSLAQIQRIISNLRVLTFGVTQECNLRCRYCAYGGYYQRKRIHSNQKMRIDAYKKAIDIFFNQVYSPLRTNREPILISFYGGETLLELENILEAANYANEKNLAYGNYFLLNFLLNTNGILLNNDVFQKLVDFNIRIDISLDGPKGEHDKFRVQKNGTGSFDDVFSNIQNIKKKNPQYYDNMIRFLTTIHPYHNVKEIEKFFCEKYDLFSEDNVLVNWVDINNLKKNLQKEWTHAKSIQRKLLFNELDKGKWFFKKIVTSYFDSMFNIPTQNLVTKIQFTANCFPGEYKLFVDANGGLHICERINHKFPIGHVSTGFDMLVIKNMVSEWNKEILENECWKCDVWWICKKCYANSTTSKGIKILKEYCQNSIRNTQAYCDLLLNLLESEDEKDNIYNRSNLISYIDSL